MCRKLIKPKEVNGDGKDKNYNRIQTSGNADRDNMVGMETVLMGTGGDGNEMMGMGTKYFTVSSYKADRERERERQRQRE